MQKITKVECVDLFCGAGGTTTGVEKAEYKGRKIGSIIACINHDPNAIISHAANFPDCLHFTEDIRKFKVMNLPKFSEDALRALWASLECTNFSNAKGGKPRDGDSRTLANHLFKYVNHYIKVGQPLDYIIIENVREFLAWGPLDKNGKPVSRDKGVDFEKWKARMMKFGYEYRHEILNSADYGAHTSRKRLFIVFSRIGLPVKFPSMSHSKNGEEGYEKWKPVKEVLDFTDEGNSIFGRKKPLVENSLRRILAGLRKFAADPNFIVQYNSGSDNNRCLSVDSPCGTVPTNNRFALLEKSFVYSHISDAPKSVDESFYTLTTQPQHAVVKIKKAFLSKYYSADNPGSMNISTEEPAHTVKPKDNHSLIQGEYLVKYYQSGTNAVSLDTAAPTLRTKDSMAKIKPIYFMDHQFTQGQKNKSVEEPAGGLTTVPKQSLVKVEKAFVSDTQYGRVGNSIDDPMFTLIARMDKKPPVIVLSEYGEASIIIYDSDSETMKEIKRFMAEHGIIDIKMRMLKVPELLKIQGFPENYNLYGSQAEQKKYIGNAVVPVVARRIIESLFETNCDLIRKAA